MRFFSLTIIITLLFSSCKKSENYSKAEANDVLNIELPEAPAEAGPANFSSNSEGENNKSIEIDQKIIKNARFRFETADISQTANKIISIVKNHKGYIESDNESKEYGSISRTITVRVPNINFEKISKETTDGINYFDEKIITSEDVTSQYIDIEARLKAKRILESRYLQLLNKADKVSDMLEIEKELSNIREEIESKEMQLIYLHNQVSMSTIIYTFYKPTVTTGTTVSYGDKLINALKSSINWIPGFILGLISIWPLLLIVFGLIYFIIRRRKRRKN